MILAVEHFRLAIQPFNGVAELSVDPQMRHLVEDLRLTDFVEGRLEVNEQRPELFIDLVLFSK